MQFEFDTKVADLQAKLQVAESSAKKSATELLDYRNMYESLERRIKLESEISTQREVKKENEEKCSLWKCSLGLYTGVPLFCSWSS